MAFFFFFPEELAFNCFSVGKTSLFALIVIILGGLDDTRYGGFFPFLGLSIATGVLTLLTLPLMSVQRTISGFFFSLSLMLHEQ